MMSTCAVTMLGFAFDRFFLPGCSPSWYSCSGSGSLGDACSALSVLAGTGSCSYCCRLAAVGRRVSEIGYLSVHHATLPEHRRLLVVVDAELREEDFVLVC